MISILVKDFNVGVCHALHALLPGLDGYFSDFFLDRIYGMGSTSAKAIRPYNKF